MAIQRKHIIIGVIGLLATAGAIAYWQYKKLMNYCVGFNRVKKNSISPNLIDFDLFLNFRNKSDVKLTIINQEYKVYLNNTLITTLKNTSPTTIAPTKPNQTPTIIGLNVKFNPEKVFKLLAKNAIELALNADKIKVKIDISMNIKIWRINIGIPYVYEATVKELMTPTPVNESTKNEKC